MVAGLISSVTLRTAPAKEMRADGTRPAVLIEFTLDDDPTAPSVAYDVVTNIAYDDAADAARKVGALIHEAAHVLLSKEAAFMDLTPPRGGGL